jgi:pimeloyl-ACP methyl ester carboxylesterase
MRFACEHNRRVESLIVADIAPKDYPPHYEKAFAAMKSIDLEHLRDRREAEEKLEPASSSWVFRQFLLTNLVRDKATGRFRWQCNLDTLIREVGQLARNPLEPGFCYPGPTLLITGALSDFVDDADIPAIQEHFPHLRTREIANASHNVHVENTPAFLDALEEFATQEWGCGI